MCGAAGNEQAGLRTGLWPLLESFGWLRAEFWAADDGLCELSGGEV
jgi:hypothetical protein